MRTAVVRSEELTSGAWGGTRHFPGAPSEQGRLLDVAYRRAKRDHEQEPDEGSEALLFILRELAAKRARSRPTSLADRASLIEDRKLFTEAGLLES